VTKLFPNKSTTIGAAILAAGLMLSGCFSILPEPKAAPTVYRLTVPAPVQSEASAGASVVNIEYPTSPRALSGTDIVLSPDGRRLTSAAAANWSEAVPSQLRNILIDTLSQDGQVIGVIPKGSTRVPYRLNMDIRRFEAVFDNGEESAPNAIVQLNLSLTDTKTRKLMGVHTITKTARASMPSVSAIVDAQDKATRDAMQEISSWLSAQLSAQKT
jgi:cholesterol transport system auxiliary component